MKASPVLAAAVSALLGACAAPSSAPQDAVGATGIGAPASAVDAPILAGNAALMRGRTEAIHLPDRITLPATYRLILLDGHLTLSRETDAQALSSGPTSMRIVMGELARGELAYQPALLPQELAAEVAAGRESAARMDEALNAVMRRSRELSDQVRELEAQSRRLAELLAGAQPPSAGANASVPRAKAGAGPASAE
jgi:hypothetical protein